MSSRGKHGVVAELSFAKRGQSTPLTAISLSSDQRYAVVGGHGIMKVIRLAPEGLSEVATLKTDRRKVVGNAGSKLSMYDVAWCPSGGNVAASLSNGGVAIWDLQHLSSSVDTAGGHGYGQLQGGGGDVRGEDTGKIIGRHDRSVNRLCWNPFDHSLLLSGSQDGFLKMWDVRCSKEVALFNSNYGAVRDIQFSPLQEFKFAAVFDNGKMQIWDYKFLQPKMKIVSHNKSAFSVEWHHTIPGRLATTSDKSVKIWDLELPTGKQEEKTLAMEQTLQPTIELASPGVVSRAKWRPGHQDQIATAQVPLMGEKDFAMMVHDVTEPAVAHFALYGGDDKKNGFCWLDTPLNFLESGGGPPRPSAPPPGAASSSKSRRVGGGGSREEDARAEWRGMGVWQHLLSCSDQGAVRVHSLAKSTLPRRNLEVFGTRGFRPSSRGEMCAWLHKREDDPAIWRIYQNEQTQAAPGMFREEMPHDEKPGGGGRRRSSSAHQLPVPPLTPQLQQQQQQMAGSSLQQQQQQQRIARSLSVGDQTGSVKGRRMGGPASAASPGVAAAGSSTGQRTASGLPRSPTLSRGQSMSGAPGPVPYLKLGLSGMTAAAASLSDDSPRPRPPRPRSQLTVYPVPDKPVAADVVNWRRIRKKEERYFYDKPQPRTGVQRCYGPELTEHLTMSLVLRGYHVRVLTEHNAEVCLRAGLEPMAHTWRMVGIMLSGVPGGLLLPLGAREPDIDVAGIDAGVAAAVAAEAAAAGRGDGGEGGVGRSGGVGGGERRSGGVDAEGGREGDFSVPEVLDLIDKYQEEEEDDDDDDKEEGIQRQLTPDQRQQQLHRLHALRPQQPSRASANLKAPPRRPVAAAAVDALSNAASASCGGGGVAVTMTSSGSVSSNSNSRHGGGASSGSGGGGGTGLSSSMWQPQPRPPPTTGTATTTDDDGREDSDGETTNTTSFAATESALWEHDGSRGTRGGGGAAATAAAAAAGGGSNACRDGRPERQERLQDEVTLDWLWKSEIPDWLRMMAEAGFAYDTIAVLEVVRSWYYGSGPGREEEVVEGREADLEEMCDIKDAPGFWLGTDIPNMEVRMWYMQGLEKLWQLQLYSAATDIIKHCGDPYISQMHAQNTTLYPICGVCGSSRSTGTSTWCSKCSRQASCCPLCDLPVVGLYVECPGCHHGGHAACMMEWFKISNECPVETCSHECKPRMPGDFTPTADATATHGHAKVATARD